MFSVLIPGIIQQKDLTKEQKCGGMGYMPGIYFLVVVFALLALGSQRMSEFSVDLTFFPTASSIKGVSVSDTKELNQLASEEP